MFAHIGNLLSRMLFAELGKEVYLGKNKKN